MKILIGYMNKNRTGINLYIRNLIENLDRKNIEITVLTKNYSSELDNYLKKKNCNLITVNHNRHFIKAFKDVNKLLKTEKHDICYFNISESFDCIGILAAKYNKIKKIIIHSHSKSIDASNKLVKIAKICLNKICRCCINYKKDICLACSDEAAKWLFPKKVYENKKYDVIKNAIDCNKYKFSLDNRIAMRKKLNIDEKCHVIGHVGSFRNTKNQTFLINLLYRLVNEYEKNIKLLLVGGTNGTDNIHKMIKEKKLDDYVIITGEVSNVEDYLNTMDVFLLPSLFEGFGMVGIEAQANGLPCIFSTNVPKVTKLTNLVEYLPLSSEKEWINKIIEDLKIERKENNYYKKISEAGYDLKNEISKFQEKYLKGD